MNTNAFISAIGSESVKNAFTNNGALTNSTSGNANLNLFSIGGASRGKYGQIAELFSKAFIEDRDLALKNIFYLRDVRGGQGERDLFRVCMSMLVKKHPGLISYTLLKLIPEYGRWDDLICLLYCADFDVDDMIIDIIAKQLKKDINAVEKNESCSLLAKWLPVENNTKNPYKKALAVKIRQKLGMPASVYRKCVSVIRRHLDIVERKMSSKKFNEINYSAVPSKASMLYRNAFMRNDAERYVEFIKEVKKGNAKINASVTYPYEIVRKTFDAKYDVTKYDETLEEIWKALPDYTQDGQSAICVCDVSGSMWTGIGVCPLDVSISLGIYFAERNTGPFKNHFITFSEHPTLVKIAGNNLYEKVRFMEDADWGGSTNIQGVFDLILNSAVKYNLTNDDMPKSIYIISDMEFNYCAQSYTNLELIKKKYEAAGYTIPTLVFWNVNGRIGNSPATQYDENTVLVSGFSPSIFRYVVEKKDPVTFMLDVLESDRYKDIHF